MEFLGSHKTKYDFHETKKALKQNRIHSKSETATSEIATVVFTHFEGQRPIY